MRSKRLITLCLAASLVASNVPVLAMENNVTIDEAKEQISTNIDLSDTEKYNTIISEIMVGGITHVYSGPGYGYSTIGIIDKGEPVQIVEQSFGWYGVEFNDRVGYIPAERIAGQAKVINVKEAEIKKSASDSADVIGTVENGRIVEVTEVTSTGKYYRVNVENAGETKVEGYIEAENLKFYLTPVELLEIKPIISTIKVSSAAYIRQSPSSSATVIGTIRKGEVPEIIGETNYYYEIKVPHSDLTGYVSKSVVAREGLIVDVDDSANVYKDPSSDSQVIETIDKDSRIEVVSESGEYYEVNLDSGTGYVLQEYVALGTSEDFEDEEEDDDDEVEERISIISNIKVNSAANVRRGPSTSHDVIATIPKGEEIKIVSETIYYYEVEIPGGTGYVSKNVVADKGQIENVSTAANIRKSPSDSSEVIGTAALGSIVEVVGEEDNYYEINMQSGTGYVAKEFVTFEVEEDNGGDNGDNEESKPIISNIKVNFAANVRRGPSTSHDVIATIPKGQEVDIVSETNYYYEVEIPGGTGYVSKTVVAMEGEIVNVNSAANIRKSASSSAEVIATAPKGSTVEVVSEDGSYYEVNLPSGTGYISKSLIEIK